MKTKWMLYLLMTSIFFGACSSGPKPISYGEENCSFCSMTIMDNKHAAEIITQKGRVYTYDSIECMIRSVDSFEGEIKSLLVMDFNNPGTFIDATASTFLVSPELPSPMGANLSAFTSDEQAAKIGFSGTLFTWDSIQSHVK